MGAVIWQSPQRLRPIMLGAVFFTGASPRASWAGNRGWATLGSNRGRASEAVVGIALCEVLFPYLLAKQLHTID